MDVPINCWRMINNDAATCAYPCNNRGIHPPAAWPAVTATNAAAACLTIADTTLTRGGRTDQYQQRWSRNSDTALPLSANSRPTNQTRVAGIARRLKKLAVVTRNATFRFNRSDTWWR